MIKKNPTKPLIAIAHGDGIGPEIMGACVKILNASGADIECHDVEVGEKVYLRGYPTGIEPKSWELIQSADAFLKAPITTPQGGGFRSLNVTIRAALGLYANVRPCVSYFPFVDTKHPNMDVVIVRENEEDLYTGIEYRQTFDSYHALKIITREGCERIVRYAFEYARTNRRKKVTCFTKDNILKLTDGLFHKVFEEIAKEYPDITPEHWIIDIGAAKLADTPENFDVIVMPNLYGDILSDVAAQIAGSVGLAGSANIGDNCAMFEAIHGSAPRRAGQNLANPSGLLLATVMMLVHVGKTKEAENIHNAWLRTIEQGIHTYDIYEESKSKVKVGTKEFAEAIIKNLGKLPETLHAVHYGSSNHKLPERNDQTSLPSENTDKKLVGVDISIDLPKYTGELLEVLKKGASINSSLSFTQLTNRGGTLWPCAIQAPARSSMLRCRFMQANKQEALSFDDILKLQKTLAELGLNIVKTENLYYFGTTPGFSLSPEDQ